MFNEKSKRKLIEIIYGQKEGEKIHKTYDGEFSPELLYEAVGDIQCIGEATNSILKIAEIMTELNFGNEQVNIKFSDYIDQGLSDKDAQVKAAIKTLSRTLTIGASRLEGEIDLFSKLYSTGVSAFETILLMQYYNFNNSNDAKKALISIEIVPEKIGDLISDITQMGITLNKLPDKYSDLKQAKKQLSEVADLLIFELNSAKEVTEDLIGKIREMK
jgi:hypothetical protein